VAVVAGEAWPRQQPNWLCQALRQGRVAKQPTLFSQSAWRWPAAADIVVAIQRHPDDASGWPWRMQRPLICLYAKLCGGGALP